MKKELHILMLEDNYADAELMERELREAGIVFFSKRVETKDAFIKELKNYTPDIILADYKLPAFDGSSALAIAKLKYPDVPVIFVTGALGEEMAVEILKEGATDYILKHRLSYLAPAVQRALREVEERAARKRAEEEIKNRKEYLETIMNSSLDLIMTMKKDGTFGYANKRLKDIFGYEFEDIKGRHFMDFIPEKMHSFMHKKWEEIQKGTGGVYETKMIKADGSIVDCLMSYSQLLGFDEYLAIVKDITERKRAEEQLKESLKEKEILLREIHHRVKNNMQVISSLLMLQSEFSKDEKVIEMFKDSQNRIMSMALIHEKLYHSESLSKIDLKEYIDELVSGLFQSYGISEDKVTLNINVENVLLGIDSAIPCGLIINELISNSLKYAFPEGKNGEIKIFLCSTNENMIEMIVRDNGAGIPKDLDFRKTESLGLLLVTMLVEKQLHGEIKLNQDKGTEFQIRFKGIK